MCDGYQFTDSVCILTNAPL